MKHNFILVNTLLILMTVAFNACNKLPGTDLSSNERQILWVSAEGQVGMTEMPDKLALDVNNTIRLMVKPEIDITNMAVEIAVSPKATISPLPSVKQDFSKGPVEYTVTSETGLSRKFKVEVTYFDDFLLGKWSVDRVDITAPMDCDYGLPRWPAPGLGQKTTEPIYHNPQTLVYTPTANGVELDNTITFELTDIGADGSPTGNLVVDKGADGLAGSRQVVQDFLEEINITYKEGAAYNYVDDFLWLPSDPSTVWAHNLATGTVSLTGKEGNMKCIVSEVDENTITISLPDNPNKGEHYNRTHNDWYDRYDFCYNVIYTLKRMAN